MGYNKVIIQGNVTRQPETRQTAGGSAVANFAVAVNRKYKDEETVIFVDCTAFGKTAEFCASYLQKGSAVLCDGRLAQDTWQDKVTGKNRSKTYVITDNVQFVGPRPQTDPQPQQTPPPPAWESNAADDQIPFA